jgi:hypothetical protein
MRAQEFTEAETGTPNVREIENKLTAAGYHKLGTGADATVWSKDEATVIKILMPDEADGSAERTFLKFYEFCQQNPRLPNLPKFQEIGGVHHAPFMIGDQQYHQIAMEKLYPIAPGSFEETMIWIMSAMAVGTQPWEKVIEILYDEQTWEEFEGTGKLDTVLTTLDQWDDEEKAEWGLLFNTMQVLYLTGQINKMGWDLHTENVMQRKDGTLVIIDPWFAQSS